MATDRIEQAQRGFLLEETLAPGRRQVRPAAASVAPGARTALPSLYLFWIVGRRNRHNEALV